MYFFLIFVLFCCCGDVVRMNLLNVTKETINDNEINEEIHAESLLDASNLWINEHFYPQLRNNFLKSIHQNDNSSSYQHLNDEYNLFVNDLALNLSGFNVNKFHNDHAKRQIKRLNKLQLRGLSQKKYQQSQDLLHKMKGFSKSIFVCTLESDETKCNPTNGIKYVPNITTIIEIAQKAETLEYYWDIWRKTIAENAKKNFINYVHLFREASYRNGYFLPSKTWYLNYDESILDELKNAIKELEPLYKEFHAHIRNTLRKKFINAGISKTGLIPEHLFEQVISQAWKRKSVFNPPFSSQTLPDIQAELINGGYNSKKIIELAAQFYNSIGLKKLPESFWLKYIINKFDSSNDCKSEIHYFPPDVGLKYCMKVDFRKFLQLHGDIAKLQYNNYRSQLSFGLDNEACPGLIDAFSEAAILASGTPNYLVKIQLMKNYTLNEKQTLNRLFRLGVHTILSIPKYFVREEFWVNVLDNRIQTNNLNCGFWELQQNIAGLSPPSKRSNSNFDLDYKFYNGIDPEHQNTIKLVGEFLGYQFYRDLCIKSNKYIPNDPLYPLHNCDFSSNKNLGKYVEEMMSLGSSKSWRDVIEILTGERKISAKGILEFYSPLYEWLKEQNKNNGVHVGWDSQLNCEDES